jgi:hypothetical protein
LFDPDENDSHPLESNVFTIVASPQEKHYKALKKQGAGLYCFPCWSMEELRRAVPAMDVLQLEERWQNGARDQHWLDVDLQKAITSLDLSFVCRYLNTPEISDEDQKMISHVLVQYQILERDNLPFQVSGT